MRPNATLTRKISIARGCAPGTHAARTEQKRRLAIPIVCCGEPPERRFRYRGANQPEELPHVDTIRLSGVTTRKGRKRKAEPTESEVTTFQN